MLGKKSTICICGKIHTIKKIKKKNRWEDKLLEKASGKGKTGVRSCMSTELK